MNTMGTCWGEGQRGVYDARLWQGRGHPRLLGLRLGVELGARPTTYGTLLIKHGDVVDLKLGEWRRVVVRELPWLSCC